MESTKKIKNVFIVLLTVFLLLLSSYNLALAENLVIKGSTTVLPIAQKCAEYYMNEHPNADISIQGGGSGVGIAAMIDGTTDIANTSRPMKDKEIKKAISHGVNPKAHVVAMDGLAVVVHPSNPLDGLTKSQIKAIYTGRISNWSQVGGPSKKIVVVSRDSASGTYEAFKELACDDERIRPDALKQASNQAVRNTVANTPGAIGYIGLGYIDDSVKALKVNGVELTKQSVASGKYMLTRPLFMYTNGEPTGLAKDFLDFVLSKRGQKLAESVGYVGLK